MKTTQWILQTWSDLKHWVSDSKGLGQARYCIRPVIMGSFQKLGVEEARFAAQQMEEARKECYPGKSTRGSASSLVTWWTETVLAKAEVERRWNHGVVRISPFSGCPLHPCCCQRLVWTSQTVSSGACLSHLVTSSLNTPLLSLWPGLFSHIPMPFHIDIYNAVLNHFNSSF